MLYNCSQYPYGNNGRQGLIKCAFEINTNEIDTTVSYVYD